MKQNHKKRTFRKFLKFSGVGVQLGVTMYLSSLLGEKIDVYYQFQKPWGTLLLIIVSLIIFIWNLTRQLNKLNNE